MRAVIAVGASALWWFAGSRDAAGRPRLVVDRAEVDRGDIRFDTPARALFTLSNAGHTPLRPPDQSS